MSPVLVTGIEPCCSYMGNKVFTALLRDRCYSTVDIYPRLCIEAEC